MQSKELTVEAYLNSLPEERKLPMMKLRDIILKSIPKGFKEEMSYGMIGFVVPHSLYPKGYHCSPELPLPFLSIASQKNFIAVYHMGIYANPELLNWFTSEYAQRVKGKLDMGKSCMRFKKPENIPFDLIGELARKMTTKDWIDTYENAFVKK
ncbi:MAG: DUF1801 domain-containing protein [Bacteroidia bacterium]